MDRTGWGCRNRDFPFWLGGDRVSIVNNAKAGDHLLMPDSVYKPTRLLCAGLIARMGVETTYYDPLIGAEIETLMKPNTSTLFLESPGSQSFEIQDIPMMTAITKRRGIATIIDNTWASPLFLPPINMAVIYHLRRVQIFGRAL